MKREIESETIQQVKDGNFVLFEEVIITYQDRLGAFLFRLVKNKDDASDLCQETFFKAYRSIGSFKGKSKFSTWIFRIGYNLSMTFLKRQKRQVPMDERIMRAASAPDLLQTLETAEISKTINGIMLELPAKYGAALHLFFAAEKSYEEISAIMKVPLNTVKSLIFRGKGLIKQKLNTDHSLPVQQQRTPGGKRESRDKK